MRPLIATIDLEHLRHNYRLLKKAHGGRLLAVVKADAYGHGAVACAAALSEADGFAVAYLDEARELRAAGIAQPIVLLEGVFEAAEYAECDRLQLSPVVQNALQLRDFLAHTWHAPVTPWLKLDSGMRRAGFLPHELAAAHHALSTANHVREVVKITHFACADEPSSEMTARQLACFDQCCQALSGAESLANSAAMLAHPAARRDWGRGGIALYGVSPFENNTADLSPEAQALSGSLKAVMTLRTRVFGVRELAAGESIGYGAIFRAPRAMRVGLIACGYADGYPRVPSNDNPVLIDGVPSRVIGRVSMDMMTVELPRAEHGIGSVVELWGENISVAAIARRSGTISYEVLCHLKRAHKDYRAAEQSLSNQPQ
ncbi:MAG: alanine racemase [Neisseria sp.]|nr:alanine racemase [Neisseria sp.]